MKSKKIFEFPIHYSMVIGQIAIGWGVYETVASECKAANLRKVFITTTGLKGTGIVEEINQILNRNGITTVIFSRVTSNPKDYEVMEAYHIFKEEGCDGVVSVGGGSSHDCGKAVRVLSANEGRNIHDFAMHLDPPWMEIVKEFKPITIPQIAVNTTAGTGAESSSAAVIVNSQIKVKDLVVLPGIAPKIALIDPLLVRQMPQRFAAWTGFDALTHAFESYICRMRSHYNLAIQFRAMKLIAENLREFVYNRMNHQACENMCWAANMSGVGIGFGGGAGIVHGLGGNGIAALYDIHHGLANAVVAVPLERHNEPVCYDKFAEMAETMGVDTRNMTRIQAADKWFDEMERLLKDLNIETGNLQRQFGFKKKDAEHIIKNQYANDFTREGNPRDYNYDDCLKLFESLI